MEAKALKSSLFSELAMKSTANQGFSDDYWCLTGFPGGGSGTGNGGDDFSIDDFFNLPNEEFNKDGSFFEEEEKEEEKDSSTSLSLSSHDDTNSNSPNFSTGLAIPVDDIQELELWSHFMDDSVPEPTLACPNPTTINAQNKKTGFHLGNRAEPVRKPCLPFIPSAVPVKPRSKRLRTAGSRTWFLGSPAKPESSSSSSSSSPVSTLLFAPPVYDMRMVYTFGKPPLKKQKKKPASTGDEAGSPAFQRRCTHCQVTKTPQWRAGPNGPKTLCNACGVRFKSGRLFPEYRPACSPTFSSEVHSNSHRKVLEMRKRKESTEPTVTTGLAPTVSSS